MLLKVFSKLLYPHDCIGSGKNDGDNLMEIAGNGVSVTDLGSDMAVEEKLEPIWRFLKLL